ncbi:MAG: IreB family regulatory phosphoprotein [Ruminococcaceae bacterium]|nr:IreB family regulatory phosphoprotein [Oscillospiraceae bacterium]
MTNQTENNTLQEEVTDMREILRQVYEAMSEKGYNPIGQIVGYLLSEDPTYITNYRNARALIRKIDRDELMSELVKNYLELT